MRIKINGIYYDATQVHIELEDTNYVRLTCKDSSHMLMNDVKAISCFTTDPREEENE